MSHNGGVELFGVIISVVFIIIYLFNSNKARHKSSESSEPHYHFVQTQRRPNKILFVDVETTGLDIQDRVVSFAGLLLTASALAKGRLDLKISYLICNPNRPSHPQAYQIHGYSDALLEAQQDFSEIIDDVRNIIEESDLIVAHNVEFDIGFLSREFERCGVPTISKPTFCTMLAYREKFGSPASLAAAAARSYTYRQSSQHSALEDAWLTMMVYLGLHGRHTAYRFDTIPLKKPSNIRDII